VYNTSVIGQNLYPQLLINQDIISSLKTGKREEEERRGREKGCWRGDKCWRGGIVYPIVYT
jgi:hypothetical protein